MIVLLAAILALAGAFMLLFSILLAVFHPLAGVVTLLILFGVVLLLRRAGFLRLTRPAPSSRTSGRF